MKKVRKIAAFGALVVLAGAIGLAAPAGAVTEVDFLTQCLGKDANNPAGDDIEPPAAPTVVTVDAPAEVNVGASFTVRAKIDMVPPLPVVANDIKIFIDVLGGGTPAQHVITIPTAT
ncbi:MAG TPA: hypothetical protein VFX21_00140, partial [Acidimicrobiia bacterium]|nr:hypothetical protein [Acidimicrobiia bacterium]